MAPINDMMLIATALLAALNLLSTYYWGKVVRQKDRMISALAGRVEYQAEILSALTGRDTDMGVYR